MKRDLAVCVRTHRRSAKVLQLLEELAAGHGYDLFVVVNETHGPLDFDGYRKISHTLADYNALGFAYEGEYALPHCSDLLFSVIKTHAPGYRHYLMLEYDVGFVRPASLFIERVAQALTDADVGGRVDLCGTHLGRRAPDWMWRPCVEQVFPDVFAVFYPFVIMSERAIDRLLELRRVEAAVSPLTVPKRNADRDNLMYCEAFTASALASQGDFKLLDLALLTHRAYDPHLFTVCLPWLASELPNRSPGVEILHPVYDELEYLQARANHAEGTATWIDYIADIDARTTISESLRQEYLSWAEGRIAEPTLSRQTSQA